MGASNAGDDRARRAIDGEGCRQTLRLRRRRHRQQLQIWANGVSHVERQRQPDVGGQIALVNLVEDDDGDTCEF